MVTLIPILMDLILRPTARPNRDFQSFTTADLFLTANTWVGDIELGIDNLTDNQYPYLLCANRAICKNRYDFCRAREDLDPDIQAQLLMAKLRLLHQWTGLLLSIIILCVAVSGGILLFGGRFAPRGISVIKGTRHHPVGALPGYPE